MKSCRVGLTIVYCLTALLWPRHIFSSPAETRTAILGAFLDEVTLLEQDLKEARVVTHLGIRFTTGILGGRRVILAASGTGKVNAAMTAALILSHFQPSEVIFSGIAGALNPQLRPGDIVIAEKTAAHDTGNLTAAGLQPSGMRNPITWTRNPVFFDADPGLLKLAEQAGQGLKLEKIPTNEGLREPRIVRGLIISGDVFIASDAKKGELRREWKGEAVEMEGAAVAQICHTAGVPCIVIRSISDSAGARARSESATFYSLAAENSSQFVIRLVGLLEPRGEAEKK